MRDSVPFGEKPPERAKPQVFAVSQISTITARVSSMSAGAKWLMFHINSDVVHPRYGPSEPAHRSEGGTLTLMVVPKNMAVLRHALEVKTGDVVTVYGELGHIDGHGLGIVANFINRHARPRSA